MFRVYFYCFLELAKIFAAFALFVGGAGALVYLAAAALEGVAL